MYGQGQLHNEYHFEELCQHLVLPVFQDVISVDIKEFSEFCLFAKKDGRLDITFFCSDDFCRRALRTEKLKVVHVIRPDGKPLIIMRQFYDAEYHDNRYGLFDPKHGDSPVATLDFLPWDDFDWNSYRSILPGWEVYTNAKEFLLWSMEENLE